MRRNNSKEQRLKNYLGYRLRGILDTF